MENENDEKKIREEQKQIAVGASASATDEIKQTEPVGLEVKLNEEQKIGGANTEKTQSEIKDDVVSNNVQSAQTKVAQIEMPKKIVLTQADIERMLMAREDVDFVADSKAAIVAKNTPLSSLMLAFIAFIFLFGIVWALIAQVDEVTVGAGKVVPSSQVQLIQNLEGGIVSKIFVKEGDIVKKGQVLARLDDTMFAAQYREGYAKWLALQAAIARLIAQTTNKDDIDFPPEVLRDPKLTQRETDLFHSEIKAVKEGLTNLRHTYKLAEDEYHIVSPLVAKGAISKVELLRLEREMSTLKQRLDGYENDVSDRNHAALVKTQADSDILTQALVSLKDRMRRTVLVSPVDGVVNEIYVNTVGGILRPAMPIMEVVPLHDQLQIEAHVRPSDIGFIAVGQKAKVKITAYDYSVYGDLAAVVTKIGATTNNDERGNSYYEVILRTDKNYLGSKKGHFPIIPGMMASVDIVTGKKSIMHYIMKPINRAKEKAMRER